MNTHLNRVLKNIYTYTPKKHILYKYYKTYILNKKSAQSRFLGAWSRIMK